MWKVRGMWLVPGQSITVILKWCCSEVVHKFLAHSQSKLSMLWLAVLGMTFHKTEQLHLFWGRFLRIWWLAMARWWCRCFLWKRRFCILQQYSWFLQFHLVGTTEVWIVDLVGLQVLWCPMHWTRTLTGGHWLLNSSPLSQIKVLQ